MARLKERTLKATYERRALREGKELLEAVDQQKLQQVNAALDRLDGLVPDAALIFNKAIEDAKADLSNYLQGGVKQFFKNIAGDPVLKATSFANAVRAGLAALPSVARLFLPKGSEKEAQKPYLQLVPQEKQQAFIANVEKAFKPETTVDITSMFKGNSMPYVANLQAAVQELLQNITPAGSTTVASQAQAAPAPEVQQANAAPQQAPSATGTTPSQAPAQSQQAAGTTPTQSVAPAQKALQSSTPKRVAPNDKAAITDMATYLTKRVGLDQASLERVLTQLAKDQKLVS